MIFAPFKESEDIMQTTFYKIKNNNEPYDILFHEPTSRFARIDKRRSEIPSEEKTETDVSGS